MSFDEILGLVTGPFGAFAVLLGVMFCCWNLVVKHLLPLARHFIDNHLRQIDQLLEEHKEDRKIYKESIQKIIDRLDKVEDDVAYIKGSIDGKK
tara:strand:+ start:162 stop:443 length:282 start_codon:yes stop_codon:yes gene_type:complete